MSCRLGETQGTVANLRALNERLEKELSNARSAAASSVHTAATPRAASQVNGGHSAGFGGGSGGGGGGLMAFAAQDLQRQLDAAQEQLAFKDHEVR